MAVTKKHVAKVLEVVEDEGHPVLHVAPSNDRVSGIPPEWARILASPNSTTDALELVWGPLSRRLPKTAKELKRVLQGVGVLTTDTKPPSLIYFLTLEDKEPFFYRGYPPAAALPKDADGFPADFLEFYRAHDGWVSAFEFAGPMPSGTWYPLGNDPEAPASKFLVVFTANNGDLTGFDLRQSPALCYLLRDDEKPKVVPKVMAQFDTWMAAQLEEMLPLKK